MNEELSRKNDKIYSLQDEVHNIDQFTVGCQPSIVNNH